MPVTHEQIALIRWSFDKLKPRIQPASTFFYEELFRLRPDLRPMFRTDDIAGQGMKFMTTLEAVLDYIETPQALAERIEELGQQHRRLGVTAEMFAPMEEALIETIRDGLDGDLGADVEAAWRAAYADLQAAMIDKGDIPEG
ncbi:globin domain-containing protein [Psychromarinibacter sp. C21-152]|uniref:Globin domain-containing protein n=1 Tax=Psychromarinibacter sediminicola TaxID=3033385 RepID=A0AAE3TB39_9RHOB|nr:globin domain-containing protein [Psychromarinibacter sediminicola]MDF0602634.1 globin domain-containing protein [Psychromarinibacter sediminicola]